MNGKNLNELLEIMPQLNKANQDYGLAILRALKFAQETTERKGA